MYKRQATSFQMGPGMTYSISIIFIMLLYLRAYLKVHVFNQVWNMTRLTDVQDQPPTQLLSFSAELKVNALFFIYLTNIMIHRGVVKNISVYLLMVTTA